MTTEFQIDADLDLMIQGSVYAEQVRCTVFAEQDVNDEMKVTEIWIESLSGAPVTAKLDGTDPAHKPFFDAAYADDYVNSMFAEKLLEARYEGAA